MPTRKWGSEKIVNAAVGRLESSSAVAALAGGGFVVVWAETSGTSENSIRAQRFDALGNKVGADIVVSPVIAGTSQFSPEVTGLSDGGFFVTWDFERPPVGGQSNDDTTGKVFNANGGFVGFLEPVPFDGSAEALRDQDNGAVARLGDGLASVAVFTEAFTPTDDEIVARVFRADGTSARIVVANTSMIERDPDVAVAPDKQYFAVVWTELTTPSDTNIGCRIFNADGSEEEPGFSSQCGHRFIPVSTRGDMAGRSYVRGGLDRRR